MFAKIDLPEQGFPGHLGLSQQKNHSKKHSKEHSKKNN